LERKLCRVKCIKIKVVFKWSQYSCCKLYQSILVTKPVPIQPPRSALTDHYNNPNPASLSLQLPTNKIVPIQPPCGVHTDKYNSPNPASPRCTYRPIQQSQSSLPVMQLPTNKTVPIQPPCGALTDQYNSPNPSLLAVHLPTNTTVPIPASLLCNYRLIQQSQSQPPCCAITDL
jgi:hypothetical protein